MASWSLQQLPFSGVTSLFHSLPGILLRVHQFALSQNAAVSREMAISIFPLSSSSNHLPLHECAAHTADCLPALLPACPPCCLPAVPARPAACLPCLPALLVCHNLHLTIHPALLIILFKARFWRRRLINQWLLQCKQLTTFTHILHHWRTSSICNIYLGDYNSQHTQIYLCLFWFLGFFLIGKWWTKSFGFRISNKNTSSLAHIFSAIVPWELQNNPSGKLTPANIITVYF